MRDFLGQQLEVGDHVVIIEPMYRNLLAATVVAFTPRKIRVQYTATHARAVKDSILVESTQLVKVDLKSLGLTRNG